MLLDRNQTKEVFIAAWDIVYIYRNKLCHQNLHTKIIFENAKRILRDHYDLNEQDVKYYIKSSNEEEL